MEPYIQMQEKGENRLQSHTLCAFYYSLNIFFVPHLQTFLYNYDDDIMQYIDGLAKDYSNSIAYALELTKYCIKQSIWFNFLDLFLYWHTSLLFSK